MFKEISIIIVIVALIIASDNLIQKYLNNTSEELTGELETIYQTLKEKDTDIANEKIIELEDKWDGMENKWSLIVLHSELDTINTALSDVKVAVETENFNDAYIEVKKLDFLFTHIAERDSFKIKNIF